MKTTTSTVTPTWCEILESMGQLNARLVHSDAIAHAILDAFDSASANAPPWVHLYFGEVQGALEASEALETLLRGYRGCAPDGDGIAVANCHLRGQCGTLPDPDSRLEKQSSLVTE